MTWGPHIRFKDTPEGVFEATETIEFISYVLLKKSKIEKMAKIVFLSIFSHFIQKVDNF